MMELIRVNDFHKSFDNNHVHRGVSFYVNKGTCCGLIGGSGQGKSVILRSIIGLEKADKGQIIVEGSDITHLTEDELLPIRKKVSYAFQGGALFDSLSVFENVAYALREHTSFEESKISKKVYEVLEEFSLTKSANIYPGELSGGMQKRVGIARALVLDPDIILFDEPTAGLDPINTLNVQQIVLRLKKRGVTSVLVTHDMPTALAVCDDILLLHAGKMRAKAKAKDVINDPNHIVNQYMNGLVRPEELFK